MATKAAWHFGKAGASSPNPSQQPKSLKDQTIDILTDRPNAAPRGIRIVRHEWLNLRIVTVRTGNLRVTERRGQLRSIDEVVLVSFV